MLSNIETKLKVKQQFENINFRGNKTVVVSGIVALLKLVAHDKSANSVSLAEDFDMICEEEGQVKHMSLYHERRFTKLGYAATSILHTLPLLQRLLNETTCSNLLVESCKLYLDCEFFLTELRLLSYFSYKVTLPLLNCVEISDQNTLLSLFPKLYTDLKNCDLTTFKTVCCSI